MQLNKISSGPRTVDGWLTDAINTAKKIIPGQGSAGTVNVTLPPQPTPTWVLPALVIGGGIAILAIFKRK